MRGDIAKLANDRGVITIAALDHRGSLKKELHPENPERTTDEEILAWKRRLVELFRDEVSGILIDPLYGKTIVDTRAVAGWILSMEKTGYRGAEERRETEILPNWSVRQAKEMGAVGVKLLLYYDPANPELASKQKEIARKVGEECGREGMIFLLEPMGYVGKDEGQVERMVTELLDLPVDVFKLEYPGSREACERITKKLKVPWVLLSAGMEYEKYKAVLQTACESGASGMAVGRSVWQEFGEYQGEAREKYFREVALTRMRELVATVNEYGRHI